MQRHLAGSKRGKMPATCGFTSDWLKKSWWRDFLLSRSSDHNANQCKTKNLKTGETGKSEAEEPYSKLCSCLLFLTFSFSVFLSRDMFLAAGENLKAIDIIGQNGWVEK